jgi:uncharacterized protein YrrD
MRKGSELIGTPVVSFASGEQLERVHDLVFDQTTNRMLGFVVDEGGWFSNARVLRLENIQSIGPDTIIIANEQAITVADADPVIQRILEANNVLKGTKIVTTDGQDLGTMVDLYFDEKTGVIEGYEASGGLFADAYTGRSFVPAPQTLKIGKDVAFVPPEIAQMMEEQVGGLKGAAQNAADATGDAPPPAATVEQAQGQRASKAVRTEQGLIIVAPGQIVTEQIVNRARTYQREEELLEAVGLRPTQTNAALSNAGDSLAAGAQNVQAGAANLWERLKAKVSDSQESLEAEREERRIRDALGRPTTRVILDPQDNVILNVGELITHKAIDRAREVGALDMLLDSVYHGEPELSEDDLRAPEPGEASLEREHERP